MCEFLKKSCLLSTERSPLRNWNGNHITLIVFTSPTHYHTPSPTQYLTTHITLPSNCIPFPYHPMQSLIQPSHPQLAPTQSVHPPQTSTLAPLTHHHTFPPIVIPPQPYSLIFNTQDGYKRTTRRKRLRMTIIFFNGKWYTMYNNNWTTWWLWWVQLQLPAEN